MWICAHVTQRKSIYYTWWHEWDSKASNSSSINMFTLSHAHCRMARQQCPCACVCKCLCGLIQAQVSSIAVLLTRFRWKIACISEQMPYSPQSHLVPFRTWLHRLHHRVFASHISMYSFNLSWWLNTGVSPALSDVAYLLVYTQAVVADYMRGETDRKLPMFVQVN